jgi:hypothetical protein
MPLPDPAGAPRSSPSASLVAGAALDAADPAAVPEAEARPEPEALELFGLPISSAGKGTGAWLTADAPPNAREDASPAPRDRLAPAEDEDETVGKDGVEDDDEDPPFTAPSGTESPVPLPAA